MSELRAARIWPLMMSVAVTLAGCQGDSNIAAPAGRPATLLRIAGNGQVGQVSHPLPDSLVVRVEDVTAQPVKDVTVEWSVGGGGGLSQTTTTTGADGRAAVERMLGDAPGEQTTTATVTGLAPVTFTATATGSGAPLMSVSVQPAAEAQVGVALLQQPVIRVQDGSGQPVAGVPVTAAVSGATLGGTTTVQSDNSGLAQFSDLVLSGTPGSYNLTFSAPNYPSVQSSAINLTAVTAGDEQGVWTQPFDWPIVAVHMILLPNGQVLSIGRVGVPQVWDPASGSFTSAPSPAWLFCAGHVLLSDGRVLVVGGHITDQHGLPNLTLFSTPANWTSSVPMARGRWYPTATTMGNGDVTILAGTDENDVVVTLPEVWSNGTVRQLTGAPRDLPWYPRSFLTADGSVFVAGPTVQTFFLSVSGAGSWRSGPRHVFETGRNYGAAVMYDDGKILYAGGANTTNTAEVIDLNQPSPAWTFTDPMAFERRHHNLTVLPTGEVLATSGVAGTAFDDVSKGVHPAELWDPTTGHWRTLASSVVTRGYHGSALLLPDGRVLNAGSGDGAGAPNERNAEIFSPPYLFRGARPVITSAPAEIHYGDQFRIETPQASSITHVSFIRLGAATHAFNQNQRFQRLQFTADGSGLTVTAPSEPNRAPPGHYLVFILNGQDVPSVAKIVRIF